jgi:tellurite resistance protein TerC
MTLLHYLHYGLVLILVFIGGKLLAEDILREYFNLEVPVPVSLGLVGLLVLGSVGASLLWPKKAEA